MRFFYMANGNNKGVAILGMIVLVGAIMIFAREVLVPFFGLILIISFIGLVISLLVQQKEIPIVFAAVFVVSLVGFGISYGVGYGIGGTSVGQAVVETYDSVALAEGEFEGTIEQIVDTSIDELCKTSTPEICNSLRLNKQLFKTAQDVKDMASTLSKVKTITKD